MEVDNALMEQGWGRQWVWASHQPRMGADLSLVTVGFSWTLVKGFLRREEEMGLVWASLLHP